MRLMLTFALSALLGLSILGQANAGSGYYGDGNRDHYSSNCDTPSRSC